jgi:hypothetical protein
VSDPDLCFCELLALAAAIGATVFAAGLATLGVAAVAAVDALCLGDGGLTKSGDDENGGE